MLASALRKNTSLTTLNIMFNDIGSRGSQHIIQSLGVNSTLTSVSAGFITPEALHAVPRGNLTVCACVCVCPLCVCLCACFRACLCVCYSSSACAGVLEQGQCCGGP